MTERSLTGHAVLIIETCQVQLTRQLSLDVVVTEFGNYIRYDNSLA